MNKVEFKTGNVTQEVEILKEEWDYYFIRVNGSTMKMSRTVFDFLFFPEYYKLIND